MHCSADVGGAVHGEDAFLGQNVVHDGEHALLDLTGVAGAADEHLMCFVVDDDGRLAVHAVNLGDALEAGGRKNGVVGNVAVKLLLGGADEKLVDEEILAGQLVYDAEALGVLRVRAGEAVEYEQLLILEISKDLGLDGVELRLLDGNVYLAPCDLIVHGGGIDDELVVRAAAGVLAGLDNESARVGKRTLAAAESGLNKLCGSEIAVSHAVAGDAKFNG